MSFISIVIPILNEEKYIATCLDSVLSSDYPHKNLEILLVDGMSSDGTRDIIKKYQEKYDFIELIDNEKKIAPVAMNLGIRSAKGEYIIRLDAHASYPVDYFSELIAWSEKLDAQNVGGVVITDVKNKNKKSNSIKEVLSHKLGVGDSEFRTGTKELKEVDTVPFGCYKKEIFEKYGYYDERLVRNQDIELNKRIINGGGKIYLIPTIKCTYFARETFISLAKNNYSNGFWNMLTTYYTNTLSSLSLRHFIPLLFVLSLFLPLILSVVYPKILWIAILSLGSYLSLVILISIKLQNNSNSMLYLTMGFLTLHFSYGLGSLLGVFSVMTKYIKGKK